MTYTLNGTDLGTVKKEKHTLTSSLDVMTFPMSASSEALIDSYEGVKRTIIITGSYAAGTRTLVTDNFLVPISALQDGSQSTTVVYHSDIVDEGTGLNGQFNVKVDSFDWEYKEGTAPRVEYTLTLIEGAA